MATGDYLDLDELKKDLWPDDIVPDDVNDDVLRRTITAVSREIDLYTGTRFYDPGADEARYYTAECGENVYIDPATSITTVSIDLELDRTYSTTLASSDWEAWPYNTGANRGQPYSRIDRTPLGNWTFPAGPRAVKVTARYCYNAAATIATTLADIKAVASLKCIRLFKRKDAPFGVLGPTELGQVAVVPGFDPDEKRILDYYRLKYT